MKGDLSLPKVVTKPQHVKMHNTRRKLTYLESSSKMACRSGTVDALYIALFFLFRCFGATCCGGSIYTQMYKMYRIWGGVESPGSVGFDRYVYGNADFKNFGNISTKILANTPREFLTLNTSV